MRRMGKSKRSSKPIIIGLIPEPLELFRISGNKHIVEELCVRIEEAVDRQVAARYLKDKGRIQLEYVGTTEEDEFDTNVDGFINNLISRLSRPNLSGPFETDDSCPFRVLTQEAHPFDSGGVVKIDVPRHTPEELARLKLPPSDGRRTRFNTLRDLNLPKLEGSLSDYLNQLDQLQQSLVKQFQLLLNALKGNACPTFEENKRLAKTINDLADTYGIDLMCKGKDTHTELRVRLICVKNKGYGTGRFEARDGNRCYVNSSTQFLELRAVAGKKIQ